MENILKKIDELREKTLNAKVLIDVDSLISESNDLKREMSKPDFWNDREKAVVIGKRVEELDSEVESWNSLENDIRELEELVAVANKEKDNSMSKDVDAKYVELEGRFKKLEFKLLFSDEYDKHNVILSIHAGSGGVDAQDWASILERMYLRFAESNDWDIQMLDKNFGNEAGIKSVSFKIDGNFAYGNLKSEAGVHRLVRISPFDAEKMRHTSFALIEVLPELPEAEEIELKDEDLKIDTFKSSGPGGQSVNTTDSAVRVVHKPTKISVSCQTERSQHQNKEMALKILKIKLHKLAEEEKNKKKAEIKGEVIKADWGKQIRSYVMHPYKMVKDHRTEFETQDIDGVLDGKLFDFIESYLRYIRKK